MDELKLNIADIEDKETFLDQLREFLSRTGATTNGIFRKDVNPENGKDEGTVQIINNVPVSQGRGVKYNGSNNLGA